MGDARAAGAKSTKCMSPKERFISSPQGFAHENQILHSGFENDFCIIIMNAAAPGGMPPRRINDGNVQKPSFLTVPKERP
jgi:hypothetical protein